MSQRHKHFIDIVIYKRTRIPSWLVKSAHWFYDFTCSICSFKFSPSILFHGKEILVIHIGGELFDTRWESYANPTENFLFFFNSLCSPFSIEFKVSIVISFQSELSKLHKKSDPRSPRLWVSISLNFIVEETYLFASKLSFKFQLAMETLPLELVRTR